MPRGLDHIVHAVRDLDAAADFYRRAGFNVSARNKHPWGTHNHVIQFPNFFIEVLGIGELGKMTGEGLAQLFGMANRDFIAGGEGFSFLALESNDIDADVSEYAANGIGTSPALPFTREAELPDGKTATVGFTLAFARDVLSPRAGYFAIQHRNPAVFWKPDYQQHRNGAINVASAVLVAGDPAAHSSFLRDVTGVRNLVSSPLGIVAATPRGRVEIVDEASFRDRFGCDVASNGEGASIEALVLDVSDVAVTGRTLDDAGIPFHSHDGRLVVAPQTAFGATLVFEP